jgi:hypothetical protein
MSEEEWAEEGGILGPIRKILRGIGGVWKNIGANKEGMRRNWWRMEEYLRQ